MWSEASDTKVLKDEYFLQKLSSAPSDLHLSPRGFTISVGAKHSSDESPAMASGHFKQHHLDNVLFSFLDGVEHWGTYSQKKGKLWKHHVRKKETGHPHLHSTTSWCRKGFNLEKSLSHFNIVFMVSVSWIINYLDDNRTSLTTAR